jgi:hypothetical protein
VPYVEVLSFGVSLAMGWTWYYGVDSANNPGTQTGTAPGAITGQTGNQPMQQSYGGEIFARVDLPTYQGFASDITLSYAEGDPTLGYTSVLHDGVRNPYFGFNRHVSEVYVALTARY